MASRESDLQDHIETPPPDPDQDNDYDRCCQPPSHRSMKSAPGAAGR
jgi:hypothetical protein